MRALLVAVAACVLVAWSPPARACSVIGPGILKRVVWPAADRVVPVNTRFVVAYDVFAELWGFSVPALGADVVLRRASGAPVDVSIEVVGTNVVVRPLAPLAPSAAYELLDRRKVPCNALSTECELAPDARVIASFMTASASDRAPPSFGGLRAVALASRATCNTEACCGPYDLFPLKLTWDGGVDETAGADVRYNVYASADNLARPLERVAGLVSGNELAATLMCDGERLGGALPLAPGKYVVRAVDWAGNEDGNTVAQQISDACTPPPDAGTDGAPADAKPTDAGRALGGPELAPRGCLCDASTDGGGGMAATLVILMAVLVRVRRRAA